jgi:hypothetical protein
MECFIKILRAVELPDAALVNFSDRQPVEASEFSDNQIMVMASSWLTEGELSRCRIEKASPGAKRRWIQFPDGVAPDRTFALTEGVDFKFVTRKEYFDSHPI